MTKAKCPHCGELVDHFDHVGEENAPAQCPNCQGIVDESTVEKVEVDENAPAAPVEEPKSEEGQEEAQA